jgi:thiamine-phosphate diphosphorylase
MTAALTIAGSDPSGGAGIQADLRTFAALGVAGSSVITALTVQNSLGVQSVHPVSTEIVANQLEAVLSDTRFHAVKIGMLGGADQVRAVAEALRQFQPLHIVLDPVLASTGGVPLLDEAGRQALRSELFPLCELITPNQCEAEAFGGHSSQSMLVKGGHSSGDPIDVLTYSGGAVVRFSGPRLPTLHTHGTGCFLSSAIAAYLAVGQSLEQAVSKAKRLLTTALQMPIIIGQGRGYPDALAAAARQHIEDHPIHRERISRLRGIYVLTDPDLRPDRTAEEVVRAALAGGASVIQLRDKHLPTLPLIETGRRLARLTRAENALLLVNDRIDVAMAIEADGVHLGPDDLAPAEARRLLGPDKVIGVSINSVDEARAAAPWASYFGVGAVYGSTTKADAGAPIGLGRLREIKASFPSYPLVAIGGITAANVAEVAAAGADSAAVISAIVAAPDMATAVRDIRNRFQFFS